MEPRGFQERLELLQTDSNLVKCKLFFENFLNIILIAQ
jgi:hypothetical protein